MGKSALSPASFHAVVAILVAVGLTIALHVLPYPLGRTIAWPLLLFSTYAHEMGHGIAALLVGGQFTSFEMWANASGVAHTSETGRIATAIVYAGGLVGPSLVAAGLFLFGCRPRSARIGLAILGVLVVASDLLVVRNVFGLAYVGVVGALLLLLAWRLSSTSAQGAMLFLAVQLALSVFSRGDYLFMRVAHTTAGDLPSDVAGIANQLFLPFWFWGIVCGTISVVVLWLGVWVYLRANTEVGT